MSKGERIPETPSERLDGKQGSHQFYVPKAKHRMLLDGRIHYLLSFTALASLSHQSFGQPISYFPNVRLEGLDIDPALRTLKDGRDDPFLSGRILRSSQRMQRLQSS
jgi:hypothetical protein